MHYQPNTWLGVSTAILNHVDIFCGWCKLYFGPLWDQVKSCYFFERINARAQCYLYKFIEIIDWETTLATVLDTNFYLLLSFYRTELKLVQDNSCRIRKIPMFATNNIKIKFFTPYIFWPKEIELDFINNCLTDNSRKSSYFSNRIG